jgi:hypothetical protein
MPNRGTTPGLPQTNTGSFKRHEHVATELTLVEATSYPQPTAAENLRRGDVVNSIGDRIVSDGVDHGTYTSFVVRSENGTTRIRSWDKGYEVTVQGHNSPKPCENPNCQNFTEDDRGGWKGFCYMCVSLHYAHIAGHQVTCPVCGFEPRMDVA